MRLRDNSKSKRERELIIINFQKRLKVLKQHLFTISFKNPYISHRGTIRKIYKLVQNGAAFFPERKIMSNKNSRAYKSSLDHLSRGT